MDQWKCCLSIRATPCCFSLLSLSMPSVSALSGMSAERSKVRSNLPCSVHSLRIFPNLRSYPLRPFSSSPRQSLIIVISCCDFTNCWERPCPLFKLPVLPRSTNRDFPCLSKNSSVPLRTPTVLADCTRLFSPLFTPDLRKSSNSSSMPLMGRCISGLVFRGFLGQAARYCCTSCYFCMSCLTVRWHATLANTAWMRSVAGAKFSSISESSSPNWSSSYISSPPSDYFE